MKKAYMHQHVVPLYGNCTLYVAVGNTGEDLRILMNKAMKTKVDPVSDYAFCSYRGSRIGVFFTRESLSPGVVSHECFHAAHRIAEFGAWKPEDCPEPFAYLTGWITATVYKDLSKHNERLHDGHI